MVFKLLRLLCSSKFLRSSAPESVGVVLTASETETMWSYERVLELSLSWLHMKLAKWIGENHSDDLRLAAAVCLHIAVALELVAGQTWVALRPGPRLWDILPWRHGPRYMCQGHCLSSQSVVPPRLFGELGCFGPSRLRYPS